MSSIDLTQVDPETRRLAELGARYVLKRSLADAIKMTKSVGVEFTQEDLDTFALTGRLVEKAAAMNAQGQGLPPEPSPGGPSPTTDMNPSEVAFVDETEDAIRDGMAEIITGAPAPWRRKKPSKQPEDPAGKDEPERAERPKTVSQCPCTP